MNALLCCGCLCLLAYFNTLYINLKGFYVIGSLIRTLLHKKSKLTTTLRAKHSKNGAMNLLCGGEHLEAKFATTALLMKDHEYQLMNEGISFVEASVS